MVLYPKRLCHKIDISSCLLSVGSAKIKPANIVRNLGSIFDKHMNMENNISSKIQSAYYQLHRISKIRNYLDQHSCKMLVNSLVTSRIDFNRSNSLLAGLPSTLIKRLQVVQNHAARLITRTRMRDHVTPILKALHWLPITQKVKYKILVLTHKCIYEKSAPEYLQKLLHKYNPTRLLRSSADTSKLSVPSYDKKESEKCFSVCAPILWNSLPVVLRSNQNIITFKKHLKTYLFKEYFS